MSLDSLHYDNIDFDEDVIAKDQAQIHRGAVTEVMPLTEVSKINRHRHNNNKDIMTQAQIKASMAGLWRDGTSYDDIAERINEEYGTNLAPSSIQNHIKSMLRYWRNLTLARVDEKQAMVLAKIEQVEELATMAYFASMSGKTVTMVQKQIDRAKSKENEKELRKRTKKERRDMKKARGKHAEDVPLIVNDDGGLLDSLIITQEKIKEYIRKEENAAGDPRFLQIILDCNNRRAQIWGLFNNKTPEDADSAMVKLTDEDRQKRLEAILNTAAQRRSADVGALAPASPLNGFGVDEEGNDLTPDDAGPVLQEEFFNELEALPEDDDLLDDDDLDEYED